MPNVKYTKELLEEVVARSESLADVLRNLGLRLTGGSQAAIRNKIKRWEIDTSHFNPTRRGKRAYNRGTPESILTRRTSGHRTPGSRLKMALAELGRPQVCEDCGLGSEWNGKWLILEVDHKDWDWLNNEPDNLRLLCPNCHSQYGSRKPEQVLMA